MVVDWHRTPGGLLRRTAPVHKAAECYRRVSDAFSRIYPSFPFGFGGSTANRPISIREGLLAAFEAEKEGTLLRSTEWYADFAGATDRP